MRPLLISLALAYGADAGTTVWALKAGAHEALIPSQHPAVIVGLVGVEAITTGILVRWIDHHGHPRLARVVGWSAVGIRGAVSVHNARVAREGTR